MKRKQRGTVDGKTSKRDSKHKNLSLLDIPDTRQTHVNEPESKEVAPTEEEVQLFDATEDDTVDNVVEGSSSAQPSVTTTDAVITAPTPSLVKAERRPLGENEATDEDAKYMQPIKLKPGMPPVKRRRMNVSEDDKNKINKSYESLKTKPLRINSSGIKLYARFIRATLRKENVVAASGLNIPRDDNYYIQLPGNLDYLIERYPDITQKLNDSNYAIYAEWGGKAIKNKLKTDKDKRTEYLVFKPFSIYCVGVPQAGSSRNELNPGDFIEILDFKIIAAPPTPAQIKTAEESNTSINEWTLYIKAGKVIRLSEVNPVYELACLNYASETMGLECLTSWIEPYVEKPMDFQSSLDILTFIIDFSKEIQINGADGKSMMILPPAVDEPLHDEFAFGVSVIGVSTKEEMALKFMSSIVEHKQEAPYDNDSKIIEENTINIHFIVYKDCAYSFGISNSTLYTWLMKTYAKFLKFLIFAEVYGKGTKNLPENVLNASCGMASGNSKWGLDDDLDTQPISEYPKSNVFAYSLRAAAIRFDCDSFYKGIGMKVGVYRALITLAEIKGKYGSAFTAGLQSQIMASKTRGVLCLNDNPFSCDHLFRDGDRKAGAEESVRGFEFRVVFPFNNPDPEFIKEISTLTYSETEKLITFIKKPSGGTAGVDTAFDPNTYPSIRQFIQNYPKSPNAYYTASNVPGLFMFYKKDLDLYKNQASIMSQMLGIELDMMEQ